MRRFLSPLIKSAVSLTLLGWLLRRTDTARLADAVYHASPLWLASGLGLYLVMMVLATWRWNLLLATQTIGVPARHLFGSYLVATFFNNFLPGNIGGDVVRVRDTAGAAQSRTLATTVILIDRTLGLMGLFLVAAIGASTIRMPPQIAAPVPARWLWLGFGLMAGLSGPVIALPHHASRLLQPLGALRSEWVDVRVGRVTRALGILRERPVALATCFVAALAVQLMIVGFYLCVARGLTIPISFAHLAVLVPLSSIVQMLPISINGFGVREATYSIYFLRLGLPLESALLLSIVGAGLIMLFSLSGAAVYVVRKKTD